MGARGTSTISPTAFFMLALLTLAELLGMSLWFGASAVGPGLLRGWGVESGGSWGSLTAAVQLGFVAGTALAALMNLADVWPAGRYFAACAALAAAANAGVAAAPSLAWALGARFLTGLFLAGVYPPGMKMIATWFRSARGLAVGTLVAGLTVGKASPWLLKTWPSATPGQILLATSAAALAAAGLVLALYHDGPFPFRRRPFSWSLASGVLRHQPTRLAILGYMGHMWELYAMWTWAPVFAAASLAAGSGRHGAATADLVAFGTIAAGGAGCVWGGWAADRCGRERIVNLSMAVSGACCLLVGLAFGASPWLLAPLLWTWGFFVVSDSAQFSTLVTEVAPDHAVGTALTLQTSVGFLLTVASIQMVPALAGALSWRAAFPLLALGPMLGIVAIRRLETLRRPAADQAASPP